MGCWVRQRLGPKDEYASRASLFGTESAVAYVADAGYQGSRRRILVIDDEPLNRAMLRELLSAVGFDAAEADSAEQALTLIQDGFHAVISDIRMPGDDGHTFCRNLRSREQTKDLVIIASSASIFADDQRLALASGFSDFLPKPVMEEELFEILGRQLGLKWIYAQESQATNA